MRFGIKISRQTWIDIAVIAIVSIIFLALWLPNLRYPLISDPVGYAHLSQSFWETGTYQIRGEPDDVFVPMHPILSYGFIKLFGMSIGMKFATLFYGWLFLIAIFIFVRKFSSKDSKNDLWLARGVALLLAVSFPTTWLLTVGNADMLYGLLFFVCLLVYLAAEKRPKLYLLLGVLMGITLLTRYMGIALFFIVFFHGLATRATHRTHPAFWAQFFIAAGIFSLWFVRHKITYGTWISTFHVDFQLEDPTPVWQRIIKNTWFYIHPLHSLALLYPFFLLGLITQWKKYLLITIAIPLSFILCYTYPSATSRFLITTIPLMIFFTVLGVRDTRKWIPSSVVTLYLSVAVIGQVGFTCLYVVPQCNAWIDRLDVPFLPKNLGLSQEGTESIQEALDWINGHAESGSTLIGSQILVEDIPVWRSTGRVREDINIDVVPSCDQPTYEILYKKEVIDGDLITYETINRPMAAVRLIDPLDCKKPLQRDPYARYW